MSLPGLQGGTKQGEIISLPAGEIPERWHQRSESLSVTLSLSLHQALADQSRDLVFRRSPGHGSQSKHDRWDPALNGRHEEPGVASGGDREMGNHSTNTGIFTWSVDSEQEEMQSHWQYLHVWSLDWLGTNDVTMWHYQSRGDMCWHLTITPSPCPHVISGQRRMWRANGGAQSMREQVFNGHGKYSAAITDTDPAQISTPVQPCDTGSCTIRGLMGLINLQRGTTKIKNKCATRTC